jgi:hypothetical protein
MYFVGKPIHGECVAVAKSSRDLAFVASVMFGGRAGIPTVNTMGCAICDFLRREDELMTELMNHKRSTSY